MSKKVVSFLSLLSLLALLVAVMVPRQVKAWKMSRINIVNGLRHVG